MMTTQEYTDRFLANRVWYEGIPVLDDLLTTRRLSDQVVEHLNTVIPILQRVFPDRWDISLQAQTTDISLFSTRNNTANARILGLLPQITIHFPHSVVRNSKDLEMDIYDLYVRFNLFRENQFKLESVMGCRMSVTRKEVYSSYAFSHLHSVDYRREPPSFSGFCLGTGEILQTMTLFNTSEDLKFFELFLYQLESYLTWESLEGTPYMKMRDTINYRQRTPSVNVDMDYINRFLLYTKNYMDNYGFGELKTQYYNNKYHLENDEDYLDFLMLVYETYKESLLAYDRNTTEHLLCYLQGDQYIHCPVSAVLAPVEVDQTPIRFRGQEIRYKVIDNDEEETPQEENTQKKYLPKTIQDYVRSTVEDTINKKATTTYIFKRIRNSNHPLKRSRSTDSSFVYGY